MASKRELLENATRWLEVAKRENMRARDGVGAIFIFFDGRETGSGVCTATVDRKRLKAELKAILKKMDDSESVIINPYDS